MTPPKNDPKLWTEEGIAGAVDEATGEMGIAIEWGWVCLGSARRPDRELNPMFSMPSLKETKDFVELWATVTVDENQVREFLLADAVEHLKPGTRFEIRKKHSGNYGRSHGMAWYTNAALAAREKWGEVPLKPRLAAEGGYYLVGEYVTPNKVAGL